MKKFVLNIVALLITLVGTAQSKDMVTIKGFIKGDLKGYHKIYMFTRMGQDSTMIRDGHYTFSFPFKGVSMKMIYPQYVQEMHMMYRPFGILIAGPGTYEITSDIGKGMQESSIITGPQSAVVYRQFEFDQDKSLKKVNLALASLYGDDWYRIEEADPKYGKMQISRDSLNALYYYPVIENLVKKYPDSYASAFVLAGSGRQVASMEQKEHLLSQLSDRMKKSDEGKKFADYIQGLKNSKIGSVVAGFSLPDPENKEIDFNNFKGKYVLIDFWASWCAPCRQSFPHMREVYQKYKGDHFEIYNISIDENKEDWLKAVKEENNPWPQSLDTKNISQSGFAVTAVPTTFLIDPNGKIIMKEIGFDSGGNSELEKKIKEIAGAKNASGKGKVIPAVRMN